MKTVALNRENLGGIGGAGGKAIALPCYDRGALRCRIVHVGLGHFHRAHQAVYIDELLNRGHIDTGIFELNLVPDPYPLEQIAREQDYLYTLIARGANGEEDARVIGSILGYLNATTHLDEALDRLSRRETEVISLTVTEKGYYYDTAAGDLAWGEEALIHDLRAAPSDTPRTIFGFLAAALEQRRTHDGGPVTIMSCDNFPSNGKILRDCVLSFCRKARPNLVSWIEKNAAFPLSMVDRITPGTTPGFLDDLQKNYGLADRWAVGCEDFRQWVLEDNFQNNFPLRGLSEVAVQIVKEVEPYELMKIRLLNGSHSALAYPAYLLGHTGVAEAASDPLLRRFIRTRYMEEISATLPPVPGINVTDYKDTLIRRFSNKNIADTILRLASDGSKKLPNAILTPLAELAHRAVAEVGGSNTVSANSVGTGYQAILFALAAWARFLTGSGEKGEAIPLEDPAAAELSAAAKQARQDPVAFLRAARAPGLTDAELHAVARDFASQLEKIYTLGTRGALEEFLS